MLINITLYLSVGLLGLNFLHYVICFTRQSQFEKKGLLLETLIGIGFLSLHIILLARGTPGPPFTSRAEIFALFSWSVLVVYFLTLMNEELKAMGGLVLPVPLLFLGISLVQPVVGSTALPTQSTGGTVPWSHIFFIVTAYGAFSVSFLMSVGYLRAEYQLKQQSVDGFFFMLPSLEALDHGLKWSIRLGLILLAAGMLFAFFLGIYHGSVSWAWIRDPNVIVAVLTGLIYGIILYIRKRSLFTNRRIAFLAIIGFILIGLMFFSMNFFRRMHQFL